MTEHKPIFPKVSVNGHVIAEAAIAAEAQNHRAPKGKPGLAWRAAARALVLRHLLLEEAGRQGLAPAPADLGNGKRETDEEALIRMVLDAGVEPAQTSEAELRSAWEADPERFRAPPLWEVSHILCAAPPGDMAARSVANARIEALQGAVRARPADFARIAARESDCGSKSSGGALGQLGPGDTVPAFEAALWDLAAETVSAPVETEFGYHLIRMDAKAEGRVLPYESARPMIAEAFEKAAWARAARDYATGLASAAEITGVDLAA